MHSAICENGINVFGEIKAIVILGSLQSDNSIKKSIMLSETESQYVLD